MNAILKEACEVISSGMFSSDAFQNIEAITQLEEYMDRWASEIAYIKTEFLEDENESPETK